MQFSLSNKEFYRRHNKELERYLIGEKCLHLINLKSKDKITEEISNKFYVDFNSDYLSDINNIDGKYNVIILTDIAEVTQDLFSILKKLEKILLPNGKLVISSINTKWSLAIKFFEYFNFKDVNEKLSYIHNKKIQNITTGLGFEFIESTSRQFIPFKILGLGNFLNTILESILYFFNLGIKTYIIFRKNTIIKNDMSRSIVIPAKNEEGNLDILFNRIPNKDISEIIFSIGESKDKTLDVAKNIKSKNPNLNIKVFEQSKTGKANAVWESLPLVTGDLVAILDADISVEPETLDDFFNIIETNNADFVNGTRLIYEMEENAMRYLNKKGNLLFQFLIGLIIKKKLTDSLCGTKVFKKEFINKLFWWQNTFKLKDPFGDFDLIFTAAFTGEKIIEYPVHYKSRIYGTTQINRFRDGFKLVFYLLKSYFVFNTSR